jgi:hypothetical protein
MTTGAAIFSFKDDTPYVEYANQAMLKVLKEMNRLSSFLTYAIQPEMPFKAQRDSINAIFS